MTLCVFSCLLTQLFFIYHSPFLPLPLPESWFSQKTAWFCLFVFPGMPPLPSKKGIIIWSLLSYRFYSLRLPFKAYSFSPCLVSALYSYNHILNITESYASNFFFTMQWLLLYLQSCTSPPQSNFRTFSSPQKKTTYPLAVILYFP